MAASLNFRNSTSVERFLYKISQDLLKGKITPSQANSLIKACSVWLQANKMTRDSEILRRLDGIEYFLSMKKKTKPPVLGLREGEQ